MPASRYGPKITLGNRSDWRQLQLMQLNRALPQFSISFHFLPMKLKTSDV